MIDSLLSIVAPHHCSGCGDSGTLLCVNCKYDINSEPFSHCVSCGLSFGSKNGLCTDCTMPYRRAWCVAPRHDVLQKLIDGYKFRNAKAAYKPLAELLHERLPELPDNTYIVPVPTVSAHIRQRGYDHTLLLARHFAKMRGLKLLTVLGRKTATTQRGENKRQRIKQAKAAFTCRQTVDPEAIYLIIDDVITTGATVKYAAQTLIDTGAGTVWVASISRQPLEADKIFSVY